jgi:hypothetical protein
MDPLLAARSVEAAVVPAHPLAAEMVVAALCALYGVLQRHFLHRHKKSTPTPRMNLVRLQLTTTMEPFLLAISLSIRPRLTWQLLERMLSHTVFLTRTATLQHKLQDPSLFTRLSLL